jgi:ribosomal protein S18 acetylase RimI-like enzyme
VEGAVASPNAAQDLESKVLFALEHPMAQADRGTLVRLLGAPDAIRQVLDYWHGGERVLLGALIRSGGGSSVASQLLILGGRTPLAASAFSGFLDEAEGRITAEDPGTCVVLHGELEGSPAAPLEHDQCGQSNRALELSLPPTLAALREVLEKRGYSNAYTYLTLLAEVPPTLEPDDPEWRDVDTSNVDAAYACCRDAFAETSAPVTSPEDGHAILLGADPRPRVLFAEGEVGAVLRVVCLDEAAHTAELRFVCRNPRFRGRRLGDRALSEAFRLLRRVGASSVELAVASTNRAALNLYDRWGFRRVGQEEVFRIAFP